MTTTAPSASSVKSAVANSFASAPVVGVVRTDSREEAARTARAFISGDLELVEITFTVPGASDLVRELLAERAEREGDGPPWIGMGTVTNTSRAREALDAGAEFIVTPNTTRAVAEMVVEAGIFLLAGALTATEIVNAQDWGADLIKVFPLPPVGGPAYLSVIRGPLGDIPMLAAGGFGIEEIPAYREAGAVAFGIGGPLVGGDDADTAQRIRRALALARGQARGPAPGGEGA
jgi:2-dehydro-3-deoxyphosphogluconate aldolase/(4S)-4-hydroxy-2-oxoglutarate aldolase